MPREANTSPDSGQKRRQSPSVTTTGSEPTSPVEKAAHGIAEAARAAERHVQEGLVATALKDISPAKHLSRQIEGISKSIAGGMGAGWVEKLGASYATDLAGGLGVAGLAPGISKRMQEALGIAGCFKSPALDVAGLAGAGLASQRLAKQLSDISGAAGLAKQWAPPTGLFAGENFKVLTAVQEMIAQTKRMEDMLTLGKTTLPGAQDRMSGGLLAGLDQLLRSPLAAKGLFPADHLTSVFGASSALDTAKLAEATIAPLAKHMASLSAPAMPNPLAGITLPYSLAAMRVPNPLAGLTVPNPFEIDAAIERVAKVWETSALWFLLSILSIGQFVALAQMDRAEVEAVLLDALEIVVTTGTFTAALIATVKKAPSYVTDDQRDDMLHGLEHAQAGEFSRAAGPLTAGLEGAIWSAGRELEVIDGDRRLLDKPEQGKIHRVEVVVRKLPAIQEFRRFVCGRVFGDLGNPLRHGEQSDRRQRSLFAIVAIAGWVETFMRVRAADALGTLLSEELALRTRR